ncbi:hypothetical protein CJ179_38820 [Rhodococcus sp. ACS1]|uniref:helix-turn-helix domain-containing protein n=1 Tax=Rhodococcus sp. ACS1 TaxID=2028570 RepID=UPI000BB13E18|nr:helix-turn-helix domain-containing protein [Rhodococcus sp. ACS1]PBC38552.1 hypothetical protein CJ179_38820 [Rhodococcus sp. ACS1]
MSDLRTLPEWNAAPLKGLPPEAFVHNGVEYITVKEAAIRCGVSKVAIYSWIKAGHIKQFKPPFARGQMLMASKVREWNDVR